MSTSHFARGDSDSSSFAALAPNGCVALDSLLLALAAEFRPVDSVAAREQLDELSRALFGVARPDPRSTAARIAATLWVETGIRPSQATDGLFFDRVVSDRRGDPALLAALYCEAARRAGVPLYVLSNGRRWLVGLPDGHRIVTIDPTSPADVRSAQDPLALRAHCAHELADAVLCELARRFRSLDRLREARRALELRLLLPLKEVLLDLARAELRALALGG